MSSSPATPGAGRRVLAARDAVELVLLFAACLAALGPAAVLDPATAIGHPTRDLFDHIALLDHWSLAAPEQAFPDGGSLFPPDPTGMALAAPLLALDLPRVTAWNVVMLVQLWLACVGGWLLGRRQGAALLGGVAFGLSPYLLGQAFSGESETIAAWPLPVMAALLERGADCWRSGRPGSPRPWLIGGGLAAALAAVGAWYHGAFVACYLVAWVALRGRGPAGFDRRALLAPLAYALAIAPLAAAYARALAAPDQLFRGPAMADYLAHYPRSMQGMVADPAALLGPGTAGAGHVDALGVVLVGLALLGLARGAPGREPGRWWGGVGLVALVLALGPVLVYDGALVFEHMPYRLLAELPLFGLMRLPHRWLLLVTLALAVLAARGARGYSWLAALLVLAEVRWFAVPVVPGTDLRPPAIVASIDGPVLDLPARTIGLDARGRYLAWQREHGQPVAYTLLMQMMGPTVAAEPLLAAVIGLDQRDPLAEKVVEAEQFRQRELAVAAARWRAGRGDRAAVEGAGARLRAMGFRVVVLHGQLLDPDDGVRIYELLRDELGEPTTQTDEAVLWRL